MDNQGENHHGMEKIGEYIDEGLKLTYLTYQAMKPINKNQANLLIPYLVWLCFATYLNEYIVFHNKKIKIEMI